AVLIGPTCFPVCWVLRLLELAWILSRRRNPNGRWDFASQSFMRTLVVEALLEAVETALLCAHAVSRRPRRLSLQVAVHALVAAVVLRLAGSTEYRANAELEQEHVQTREASQAGRAERLASVAVYFDGKPVFAKRPLIAQHHRVASCRWQRMNV